MDQFISALGQANHAMLLDCRTQQPTMLPLTDPAVTVLIANTNVKHELTGGEYAERRRQCETAAKSLGVAALRDATTADLLRLANLVDATVLARARHVIGEDERTLHAAAAIRVGDWRKFGELMFASHASLRDDFAVSCEELDVLVALAAERVAGGDVYGSRMTGGGFGGCMVSLIRTDAADRVTQHLSNGYRKATGREATIFRTRPGAGARVLAI
jgi:galactokinase